MNYTDLNPNTERNLVNFLAVVTMLGSFGAIMYHVCAPPGNTIWNPALIFFAGLSLFWAAIFLFKTIDFDN